MFAFRQSKFLIGKSSVQMHVETIDMAAINKHESLEYETVFCFTKL